MTVNIFFSFYNDDIKMKNNFFQKVGLGILNFFFFRIFVGKLGPTFCDLLMLRLVKMGLVSG